MITWSSNKEALFSPPVATRKSKTNPKNEEINCKKVYSNGQIWVWNLDLLEILLGHIGDHCSGIL